MKRVIQILAITIITLTLTSCDEWLIIKPKNSVPMGDALSTITGNKSCLMGAYSIMQGSGYYGRSMIAAPEVMADNAKIAVSHGNVMNNEGSNVAGSHCNIWTSAYAVIRNTNFVIEAIDDVKEVTATDAYNKRLLKGEAYFLRGMAFFDMVKIYAREPNYLVNNFNLGVILQTEAFIYDGTNLYEAEAERASVTDSYNQVISDLSEAFRLLENNDSGNFPDRASALSAKALLARVYLHLEEWDKAIEAATWVINNAAAYSIKIEDNDYNNVFNAGSETIFQLTYTSTDNLGSSSMQSIYTNTGLLDPNSDKPDWYRDEKRGSGYGDILFSVELYNTFEQNDLRRSVFKKVIRGANLINPEEGIWCFKFNGNEGVYGLDNIPILRLSEMYHIRLESYLRKSSPDISKALGDLNYMRGKRGLDAVSDNSVNRLLEIAEHERRLEFIGEGHRFFDLKRRGLEISKSAEAISSGRVPLTWDDPRVVARIPLTDAQPDGANPNLIQNPGY